MAYRRILLIDPDPADRSLAAKVLGGWARVDEVEDGVRFADALARGRFDLAVTEHRLGWADGLQVIEALKTFYPERPVVLLAEEAGAAVLARGAELGLDAALAKDSAGYRELPSTVAELLGEDGAAREDDERCFSAWIDEVTHRIDGLGAEAGAAAPASYPRSGAVPGEGPPEASILPLTPAATPSRATAGPGGGEAAGGAVPRVAFALEGARIGIWEWYVRCDALHLSENWRRMLGLGGERPHVRMEDLLGHVHPEDRERFRDGLDAYLAAGGGDERFEEEHRLLLPDGDYLWVLTRGLAVRDEHGEAVRVAGSMVDLTARRTSEEQLLHDAFHDRLTGLPNRALFSDRLGQTIDRGRRGPVEEFGVLFVDLDRFKMVNDSLGHEVGDALLVSIARRLERSLRPGDTVARLGGDEFALLVHGLESPGGATHVASRVLEAVSETCRVDGYEIVIGASIGIALSSGGYQRADDMLRDADRAMYRAKAGGGGDYEVFDRDMHRRTVALMRLETELRRAVDGGRFVAHFQPIVALESSRIVAFETMVRWHHPRRGLMFPEQFLAVAEETGLIVPIGWSVLEESCRQVASWRERFPLEPALTVSCNVSGRLFRANDVAGQFEEMLARHGLDPGALRLEITEKTVLEHGPAVLDRMRELRELGLEIQIDDFGTGTSSIGHLRDFPYHSLKIDRSCIHALTRNGGSGDAVVQSILALGNHLEMGVIAEGIETEAQLHRLRELGCPQGQGFWFDPAVPGEEATELLLKQCA